MRKNMKKITLVIAGLSLIAIIIGLGAFRQTQNAGSKSAKEWVMMAVEEEYYQLDNNERLLTHTAVIQTPSLEFTEKVEGEPYGDYLYVKEWNGDDNYYVAFFRHYLVVDDHNDLEEYVYMSAIAWEDRSSLIRKKPKENRIHQWQILELDIEQVEKEFING